MLNKFCLRQLLACMNISVFNPVMDDSFKKISRIETEQGKEGKTDVMLLLVMLIAAFICFWGLRPYPFVVGAPMLVFCALALREKKTGPLSFLLKTYLLCGAFLLTEAFFKISPVAIMIFLFILMLYSIFHVKGAWSRTVVSGLFFCCVYFSFENVPFVPLVLLPILGTVEWLFPLKNRYAREPALIFIIFPLLFLLGSKVFPLPENFSVLLITFTLQLVVLGAALFRDLELEEKIRFCFETVCLFLCGFFLSAGIQGSVVLFFLAYFTNTSGLVGIAAVMFMIFFILSLMSLSVSLFSASMIAAAAGTVFLLVYFRLGRLLKRENEK